MKNADAGRSGTKATKRWERRPVAAAAVRLALFVAPVLLGWLAVRHTQSIFWRPEGWVGALAWLVQAVIVAAAATSVVSSAAARLAPLSTMLTMTLVFPDHAPSRFGLALRAGTVKKLTRSTLELSDDVQQAAEQAVALVAELGRHEKNTRGHTERVRAYSELIGEEMGLPDRDLNMLRWSALLHDVGKLAVPAEILNKEEELTEDDWTVLKLHPAAGGKALAPLVPWLGDWARGASEHHEHWDGKGYPTGKSGLDISLAGRIISVADAYDVITSKRSYKEPVPVESARSEIVLCAGKQFDPTVVRAFLRIGFTQRKAIGFFSWLFEVPGVVRLATTVASAPAISTAALVSVAIAAGGAASEPPDAIAFDEPVVVIEDSAPSEESTTTSTSPLPTSTSTDVKAVAPTTTELSLVGGLLDDLRAPMPTTTAVVPDVDEVEKTAPAPASSSSTTTPGSPTTTTVAASPTTTSAKSTTTSTSSTTTTTKPSGAPALVDDNVTAASDQRTNIHVLANDSSGSSPFDERTLEIITFPSHFRKAEVHDDHLHYRSREDFEGIVWMEYRVCNQDGLCSSAWVRVLVIEDD